MGKTNFSLIYDRFLTSVTDDMYMELTTADTYLILQDLLLKAIIQFEFPKFDIYNYEKGTLMQTFYQGVESSGEEVEAAFWQGGFFNADLSQEEIEILSVNMIIEWLNQQLLTTEHIKQKYSGVDFKVSSQANHMNKIRELANHYRNEKMHIQRLYCRRKRDDNGIYRSQMWTIMSPQEDK